MLQVYYRAGGVNGGRFLIHPYPTIYPSWGRYIRGPQKGLEGCWICWKASGEIREVIEGYWCMKGNMWREKYV